jgi:hypothetical protein
MDWFEQLAKAKSNGLEYATNGIAAGEVSPQESPLSGEWAGAITPRDVVEMSTRPLSDGDVWEDGRTAGPSTFDGAADWEIQELCDAWEDGYNSAPWPEPAVEVCEHGLSAHLCGGPNHWYDRDIRGGS